MHSNRIGSPRTMECMSASAIIRWSAGVLLALYTVVIAKLTLQPASAEQHTFTLLDRTMTRVSGGRLDWSQTEMLANIALFIPAGFLLAVVLRRVWAGIALCLLASICIELAQYKYLPTRVPTMDDVQRNTIGGAIGACVAGLLSAWTGRGRPISARPSGRRYGRPPGREPRRTSWPDHQARP